MPLETASYLSDLVTSNPAHTDGLSQADSHMRLLKAVLQATFPNINAAVTATPATLNALNVDSGVKPGFMMDYGGTTAPSGWLACDGQAISRTTYAALFTAIGTTWGAGDGTTTFNVPPLQSYFRRHRDGNANYAGAVGTLKVPANFSHTHGIPALGTGGASVDHSHTQQGTFGGSGTTGTMNSNTSHTHGGTAEKSFFSASVSGTGVSGGVPQYMSQTMNHTTDATNTDHTHGFSVSIGISGQTGGRSADHSHTTGASTTGTGSVDSSYEARPFSAAVLTCIKY